MIRPPEHGVGDDAGLDQNGNGRQKPRIRPNHRGHGPDDGEAAGQKQQGRNHRTGPEKGTVPAGEEGYRRGDGEQQNIEGSGPMQRIAIGCVGAQNIRIVPLSVRQKLLNPHDAHIAIRSQQFSGQHRRGMDNHQGYLEDDPNTDEL